MKIRLLLIALIFGLASVANALPALQLFIAGASYDYNTETWLTEESSFDLYVISANDARNDVMISLALGQSDNPFDISVNFAGTVISNTDWVYGYAPIDNNVDEWDIDDLRRHKVFPTYFSEVNAGNYGVDQEVGSTLPDENGNYWDPSLGGDIPGYVGMGEVRSFHVEIQGMRQMTSLHFDAYTLNEDGTINEFTPFNNDAGVVGMAPEPGTITLLGLGLLGVGARAFRRKR